MSLDTSKRRKTCPEHLAYGDLSATAPWRDTGINHECYILRTPEENQTPWLAIPGFRLELIYDDLLHVLYLGILKDTIASSMATLVEELAPYVDPSMSYDAALKSFPWASKKQQNINFGIVQNTLKFSDGLEPLAAPSAPPPARLGKVANPLAEDHI